MLTVDISRLNTMNGIFSITKEIKYLMDCILLYGYQSRINNTAGRETAMDFAESAKTKRARDRRYHLLVIREM